MVREWRTCLTREAKPICRTKAANGWTLLQQSHEGFPQAFKLNNSADVRKKLEQVQSEHM